MKFLSLKKKNIINNKFKLQISFLLIFISSYQWSSRSMKQIRYQFTFLSHSLLLLFFIQNSVNSRSYVLLYFDKIFFFFVFHLLSLSLPNDCFTHYFCSLSFSCLRLIFVFVYHVGLSSCWCSRVSQKHPSQVMLLLEKNKRCPENWSIVFFFVVIWIWK